MALRRQQQVQLEEGHTSRCRCRHPQHAGVGARRDSQARPLDCVWPVHEKLLHTLAHTRQQAAQWRCAGGAQRGCGNPENGFWAPLESTLLATGAAAADSGHVGLERAGRGTRARVFQRKFGLSAVGGEGHLTRARVTHEDHLS